MVIIFIQIAIVLLVSVVLYAGYYLGKNNPTMIAGFKWGVTADEVREDKRWLKLFSTYMKGNVYVTLIAGIVASVFGDDVCYLAALILPTVLVTIYLAVKQPRGGCRM